MVAAAVIFPPGEGLRGVDDSKRLEPAEREELAGKVRESAVAWAGSSYGEPLANCSCRQLRG